MLHFLAGNGGAKKKDIAARCSAEAEFQTMAQDLCGLLWLKIS